MGGIDNIEVVVDGMPLSHGEQTRPGLGAFVSDGYFRTMNTPIQAGRGFFESDREDTPLVAVVNEHMARHYWPQGGALGKRFHLGAATGPAVEIVGIARNAKYAWIAEPPMDFVYLPFRQHPRSQMSLLIESNAPDAATLVPVLRDQVRRLDPDMPVYDVRTMSDFFNMRAVLTSNIITQVVAGMGLMGLLLAVVGLYGLVAYSVSRRTHEIGIRMAIGADRQKVVRMILGQGLQLGVAGTAAGLVTSFFACRLVTSALSFVTFERVDPWIFVILPVILLGVTVLATWAPARRASRIDPMRALRDE